MSIKNNKEDKEFIYNDPHKTKGKNEILDNTTYSLPSDKDYYINAVDTQWYDDFFKSLKLNTKDNNENSPKFDDIIYYMEDPPLMSDGFYPEEHCYVISPRNLSTYNSTKDVFLGAEDGDTISFSTFDTGYGDSETKKILDNAQKDTKTKLSKFRFLCIDAPEVPHANAVLKRHITDIGYTTLLDLQNKNIPYLHCKRENGDKYIERDPFEKVQYGYHNGRKVEIMSVSKYMKYRGGKIFSSLSSNDYYICMSSDKTDPTIITDGIKASEDIYNLIQQGVEFKVIIPQIELPRNNSGASSFNLNTISGHIENKIKKELGGYSVYTKSGFNSTGLDLYGRILGLIYVKIKGKDGKYHWINASKYVASRYDSVQINKSINGSVTNGKLNNFMPSIIKPETFEKNTNLYADAVWDTLDRFDDRYKIQRMVFNKHRNNGGFYSGDELGLADSLQNTLSNWTVVLGDCCFMVPPTSIRYISQTATERIPVVRARGTIAKGLEHNDDLIELTLYFNGLDGINGVDIAYDLPTAKSKYVKNKQDAKVIYSMNGFRSLIAHFKLVPFLPITNKYINEVLNISAVCFSSLNASTVPDFPELIECKLMLRKFSYETYLPQIPIPTIEDSEYRNYFSKIINYETLRYYYQRPIRLGNELFNESLQNKEKIDITSKDFMQKTIFSNRTAMLPVQNLSPYIDFYIANEDHLKHLLNTKIELAKKKMAKSLPFFSPSQKTFFNEIIQIKSFFSDIQKYLLKTKTLQSLTDTAIENIVSAFNTKSHDKKITFIKSSLGIYGSENTRYYDFQFRMDTSNISYAELKDLKEQVALYTKRSYSSDLNYGIFTIRVNQNIRNKQITISGDDVTFINDCFNNKNILLTSDGNEEAEKIRNSINLEDVNSVQFEPYLQKVRVDNFSIAMGNTFTKISPINVNNYAPQYMGGTDTQIQIQITTTDERIAGLLGSLLDRSAYLHRTYHDVLPIYPVKLDSEFTRLIGATEIAIDNIIVNTVPNFPGTYTIQIVANSIDRTLRNREALKQIDIKNQQLIKDQDKTKTRYKNYFQLNSTISKVNLYPDLELPTIKELSEHGFQFLRYKNRKTTYPDPDFYFIYPGVILNEIIRETVIDHIKNLTDENRAIPYKDKYGASIKMTLDGKIICNPNDAKGRSFLNQIKTITAIQNERELEQKNVAEEVEKEISGAMTADYGSWDISSGIKCMFMESYFYKELKLYSQNKDTPEYKQYKNKKNNPPDSKTQKLYQTKKGEQLYKKIENKTKNIIASIDKILTTNPNKYNHNIISSVMQFLNFDIDTNSNIRTNIIDNLEQAAYCSLSSDAEFIPDNSISPIQHFEEKKFWQPNTDIIGLSYTNDPGNTGSLKKITREEFSKASPQEKNRILDSLIYVSPYRIKFYTKKEFLGHISLDGLNKELLKKKDVESYTNLAPVFCLDPYYRYASVSKIREFKRKLVTDNNFARLIWVRQIFYWIKRLYSVYAFPNISFDLNREVASSESSILQNLKTNLKKFAEQNKDKEEENISEFQRRIAFAISKFVNKSSSILDAGKLFSVLVLTITNGDKGIWQAILRRDYTALNGFINETIEHSFEDASLDNDHLILRKFLLALVGLGVINDPKDIGHSIDSPSQNYLSEYNLRKVLQATLDPQKWLYHSFIDMVQTDFRGRMLRAFPTFYMVLLDEGRDLGFWKLHDNFYTTNAINKITITKSRKNPIDTCQIILSNIFNTFNDDYNENSRDLNYSLIDAFDSVFSPYKYASLEELRRQKMPLVTKAKIIPGTRIHVRLGYGNDASIIPAVFNGVVAECSDGPCVTLIAQGDGSEVCNPLTDVSKGDRIDDIMHRDDLFNIMKQHCGQTPKSILDTLFTQTGSWLSKQFKDTKFQRFFNENPYGLYHFGDRDFKSTSFLGEPTQNFYEVDVNPSFGYVATMDIPLNKGEHQQYADFNSTQTLSYSPYKRSEHDSSYTEPPLLSFYVANKTIWDIMHICRSANPSYITSITNFGFRSTAFLGRPNYYSAYGYKIIDDSAIIEKRKPFQQYHIYLDSTDIIDNQITTSTKRLKTVVTGTFSRKTPFTEKCKIGPLYADGSMFPENLKGIFYDTQLVCLAKDWFLDYPGTQNKDGVDSNGILSVINRTFHNGPKFSQFKFLYHAFTPESATDDEAHNLARNSAASKLQDCMKEIYQGNLVLIGDPSVKPYDRFFIQDSYRDMNGQALVRDVTHIFGLEDGFVTTITPDAIAVVDTKEEYLIHNFALSMITTITRSFVLGIISWKLLGINKKYLFKALQSSGKVGKYAVSKIPNKIKDIKNLEKVEKVTEEGKKAINVAKKVPLSRLLKMSKFAASISSTLDLPLIAAGFVLQDCVGNYVANLIKDYKMIKVFPLVKNAKPYVAGLEGSHGLVYGLPDSGKDIISILIDKLFTPSMGNTMTDQLKNILLTFLVPDNITEAAAALEERNSMVDSDGNAVLSEENFKMFQNSLITGNSYYKYSSTNLATVPRVTLTDIKELTHATVSYRATDVHIISTDTNLVNAEIIEDFPGIKTFLDEKFLRLIHLEMSHSSNTRVKKYTLKRNSENRIVYGLLLKNNYVDLPLLNRDTCQILLDLLRISYDKTLTSLHVSNNDETEKKNKMAPEFLILKKAFTVGDKNVYASSGFSFSLEPHGKVLPNIFKQVIYELITKINKDKKDKIALYTKSGTEYKIILAPRTK